MTATIIIIAIILIALLLITWSLCAIAAQCDEMCDYDGEWMGR